MKQILLFIIVFISGIGICFSQTDFFNEMLEKATAGDSNAQANISAEYYLGGHEVPQDYKKAFEWAKKSANQGNTYSQFIIGEMYYEGLGVTKSYKDAFKWYKLAAEKNMYKDEDPEVVYAAQIELGKMYYEGLGVTKNYEKAYYWNKKREEDKVAQNRLGNMFRNGLGVQKNYKEALKWFKNSADQGWAKSQYDLGTMYYEGEGVPINYIKAYKWVSLSATTGEPIAKSFLNALQKKMTVEQVFQAQKEASEWWEKFNN